MRLAYACEIKEANFAAIRSEMPNFNLEETREWIKRNGRGWFIRDEDSFLDCVYLAHEVFLKHYAFDNVSDIQLFRPLLRL